MTLCGVVVDEDVSAVFTPSWAPSTFQVKRCLSQTGQLLDKTGGFIPKATLASLSTEVLEDEYYYYQCETVYYSRNCTDGSLLISENIH